jgi:hypothetical protein
LGSRLAGALVGDRNDNRAGGFVYLGGSLALGAYWDRHCGVGHSSRSSAMASVVKEKGPPSPAGQGGASGKARTGGSENDGATRYAPKSRWQGELRKGFKPGRETRTASKEITDAAHPTTAAKTKKLRALRLAKEVAGAADQAE